MRMHYFDKAKHKKKEIKNTYTKVKDLFTKPQLSETLRIVFQQNALQ